MKPRAEPKSASPTRRTRIVIALSVGLVSAGLTATMWHFATQRVPTATSDWDALWYAAKALLSGHDPYAAIKAPPWPWRLLYPLPAVLVAVPFTVLPLEWARAAFAGVGSAALGFAVTRTSWWPICLAFSAPALDALWVVQWPPLLLAAALLPWLGCLLVAKPTIGAGLWMAKPTWQACLGGMFLIAVCFAVSPGWLGDWRESLQTLRTQPHLAPIQRPGGALLLMGALRWRHMDGRLLVAWALVPQTTAIYELLPLALLCDTPGQLLMFCVLTFAAAFGYRFGPQGSYPIGADFQWLVLLCVVYLPAVALLLARRQRRIRPLIVNDILTADCTAHDGLRPKPQP